ncbi:uncharacterized protein N0V89_008973 [Didymosphaeria variabile]|uniref:WKF domain-containing protein n=1 Tax=Didymosphaeria variabile TaxID=1932322 RepID=A0A9W8XHS7_9PLEO|nr:uncharacterized protein N0V89_008973 [Didymosphaeria variabile]KAJ4350352.1 hypothetical protein N0V89_008973 [Didymosphaeria variabile]
MAQSSTFVPAWKRLGLKLKNFPKEPETNHQTVETQSSLSSVQHDSELQEDRNFGQASQDQVKLGKRKHHSDAADVEGASVKKSKHDWADLSATGDAAAAPEAELNSMRPAASEASPADQAQPKGDPNYRKKKGGDLNYRKKKEKEPRLLVQKSSKVNAAHEQSLAPPKAARTPSLSPGRTDSAANGSTLLPSTEIESLAPPSWATPQRQQSTKSNSSSLSPPKTDRRKSVTFTPDTKASDGNSASNYFKQWVAEQKGSDADFTPAEVAQFAKPPEVHIANSNPSSTLPLKATTTGKKKDPSRYLNYLAQYYQDRANWKFNKATQNDVLENSLNIFRIPEEYSDALLEYVRGLKGAGVIDRLRERCMKTIDEVNEEESKAGMDEREAMKEDALQERLSTERKRRRTDGDIENMADHQYPEGYVRRLKRSRAEALCRALNIAMPVATTPQNGLRNAKQGSSEDTSIVAQNNARKRKRRTDVSSDESSDSSSSEEEDSSSEGSSGDDSSSSDEDKHAGRADAESDTESSDGSGDSSASGDDSD